MKIGYDQGESSTILMQAKKVNFDLGKITTACGCDCSNLAGVCGIAAGAPKSVIYQGGNLCYTGNIADRFKNTGLIDIYTSSDYVSYTAKWQVGDILVSNSHTVIVVSGTAPSDSNSDTVNATSNDIESLAQVVIAGRYGHGDDRKATLGDKYEAVQARVNELLSCTSNAAGTSTGIA